MCACLNSSLACVSARASFSLRLQGLLRLSVCATSCPVFEDVLRFQKEGVETNDRPQNCLKGVKDQSYVGRGHGRKLVLDSLDRDDATG